MRKYNQGAGEAPEIGSEIRFYPHSLLHSTHYGMPLKLDDSVEPITGVCVYVNEEHRFARYAYHSPGAGTRWECFKF